MSPGRRGRDDLIEAGAGRVARQQLPTLPESGERPQHLAVTNLEATPEHVHVELDRVGDRGGRRDRGGEVPGAVGDPLHDATRTRVVPRRASGPLRRSWPREVAITLGGAATYFGLRVVVEGDRTTAIENAERVLKIEQALGIDIEQTVQTSIVDNSVVRTLGNLSYVWLHWPLLIAVFVALYRLRRDRFLHLRRAMFWSGGVGLILFTVFPTAPPRFLPGFVGTVSDDARRHYLTYPLSWTNQVAAVPSFHAGWTLIACLALAAVLARPAARVAAIVPAVLVLLSVVTTGNHYILDTVLGTAIAVAAYVLADPERRQPARR